METDSTPGTLPLAGTLIATVALSGMLAGAPPQGASEALSTYQRVAEWTIESNKSYADPFNDVDVDVVFERDGHLWRIPTFWRGGGRWTVRFAPPVAGEYSYHLESTDHSNPDLNDHAGRITVTTYTGSNELLRHGMLRVSTNKHYFEYEDGTPFFWLADTWWTGLSDRLSWKGFEELTADRKAKGFTVVQVVAGLIPDEERAPVDPGYCNEGGCVWDPEFKRINPQYFDYADRRIQHLVDAEIVPAIVGAWSPHLRVLGIEKMKKHWRYVIARYGAYPVFWIGGGEVYDPPESAAKDVGGYRVRGWSEIVSYIRKIDPYHHPVSVHDLGGLLPSLQDSSLTDYYLFQCGHFGWTAIPTELQRLQTYYSDPVRSKPIVIAEIGYEGHGAINHEEFQRAAFWLAMLNGAAGFTYGTIETAEAYAPDKSLHRLRYSFDRWNDAMKRPGSYELGLGSRLLRQHPWWQLQPDPQLVAPHGDSFAGPDVSMAGPALGDSVIDKGNFFLPYAADVPGRLRLIYLPYFDPSYTDDRERFAPTVLRLEPGVRYHAYFWDPALGTKFDLGIIERPTPAAILYGPDSDVTRTSRWHEYRTAGARKKAPLSRDTELLSVLDGLDQADVVTAVNASSTAEAGLILRFKDPRNFMAAVYSAKDRAIYLFERRAGKESPHVGRTPVGDIGANIRLTAETRGSMVAMSITDGHRTVTSPIVDVVAETQGPFGPPIGQLPAGRVGILHREDGQSFRDFEVRHSPTLVGDSHLESKLFDAEGRFRGEMLEGSARDLFTGREVRGWGDFGRDKYILLDAYRPQRLPFGQDWVLVLDAQEKSARRDLQ